MFRLDVLQNQWLILSLLGGVVVLLGVVLWYLAEWRLPDVESPSGAERRRRPMPWVLIVVYVGLVGFAIVYVWAKWQSPPNW